MTRIALLLLATLLAGCAATGGSPTAAGPATAEEARCRQHGGTWRVSYCDPGAGGGY